MFFTQAERRKENYMQDFPGESSCQGSGKTLLAIGVGVLCMLLREQQERLPWHFPKACQSTTNSEEPQLEAWRNMRMRTLAARQVFSRWVFTC